MKISIPGSDRKITLTRTEQRSKKILLSLTPTEFKQAQALAQQSDLTVSELFRRKTLRHTLPQKVVRVPLDSYQELSTINAQLREMLHHIRAGKAVEISAEQLTEFQRMVEQTQASIVQLFHSQNS